jgi:hypothetical protein
MRTCNIEEGKWGIFGTFFEMINGLVYTQTKMHHQQEILAMKGKREQQAIQTLYCSVMKKCKTVTYQTSFINRTTRIWNILPNELKEQSDITLLLSI